MPAAAWFAELIEREMRPWLALSEDQLSQLWTHCEVLLRWNEKISLTSIPAGEEMVVRHYCESLFFAVHIPDTSPTNSVTDLGSGAGFPGVPIAISRPAWRVTLVESNQRKAVFLREATRGLGNITVSARRAESIPTRFDWLVSRGVDPSAVLKNAPRLAERVGLMVGEDDFSVIRGILNIAWSAPVQLPWGDRRLCIYGVSRET